MDELELLKQRVTELEESLRTHLHTGEDGSEKLKTYIELPENEFVKSGSMAIEGQNLNPTERLDGFIVVGEDKNTSNGSDNTQIVIQHFKNSNDTFMFGQRSPLYIGTTGDVNSGGTTMSQSNFTWDTNELAGAYVVVYDSNGDFDCYQIASNTADTITITGGTWSFSEDPASFVIYVPVYFGSAEYPWRRLYTTEGVAGGIRFGLGMTNAGQQDNGMLYMDSAGDLYWRNKAGTSTKLN